MATALADGDLDHFASEGWLLRSGVLDDGTVACADAAIEEVAAWAAADDGRGLHHWELTADGPALARSEDLVPHHERLRSLICDGLLPGMATALLGEPAVLFKEKVNYRHPGGAGFAPHQDATAYRFIDHHVSCMVPLDPATTASGCLWVASGLHHGPLTTDDGGCIDRAVADRLDWEPVEVARGDVLWFDSYTPHRSDTNTSDRSRRALYLTYNAASKGDLRERYYADKRAEFAHAGAARGDERVQVSITDDFLGRPLPGGR